MGHEAYAIWGILSKTKNSSKTSTSAFIDYAKAFDCVDHNTVGNS